MRVGICISARYNTGQCHCEMDLDVIPHPHCSTLCGFRNILAEYPSTLVALCMTCGGLETSPLDELDRSTDSLPSCLDTMICQVRGRTEESQHGGNNMVMNKGQKVTIWPGQIDFTCWGSFLQARSSGGDSNIGSCLMTCIRGVHPDRCTGGSLTCAICCGPVPSNMSYHREEQHRQGNLMQYAVLRIAHRWLEDK